ncbi:SDR family NAD(P)-dependent oxidoreductase [Hymenobacter antarcticus]
MPTRFYGITGGADGIGLATAKRLARKGARIVLADYNQATLAAAVPEVQAAGTPAIGGLFTPGTRGRPTFARTPVACPR